MYLLSYGTGKKYSCEKIGAATSSGTEGLFITLFIYLLLSLLPKSQLLGLKKVLAFTVQKWHGWKEKNK